MNERLSGREEMLQARESLRLASERVQEAIRPALERLYEAGLIDELPGAEQAGGTAAERGEVQGTARGAETPKVRARRLGIRSTSKLARWDRIEREYVPKGLTQAIMAELENTQTETIQKDVGVMKRHPDEFPNTAAAYPRKTIPLQYG